MHASSLRSSTVSLHVSSICYVAPSERRRSEQGSNPFARGRAYRTGPLDPDRLNLDNEGYVVGTADICTVLTIVALPAKCACDVK